MVAAALAVGIANSALSDGYFHLLHAPLGPLSVHEWINDGLMALFFLLVGLEIKREVLDGQLSTPARRVLPGIAAFAGMVVPALIFWAINRHSPETRSGWAVPTATDIAFALGVLALLGRMVPGSVKPFLTAVAVIDDLGAVLVIALFYTSALDPVALGVAAGLVLVLVALNRRGVMRLTPYLVTGALLWVAVLMSGIHATIAGVVTALAVPLLPSPARPDVAQSPLHRLEHGLHPWVAFGIVPLFGLANAGVDLRGMELARLLDPLPLGIALGLFLGKQLGVFTACRIAVGLNWAERPAHASWLQIYGVAILCGIGFTMSLFIGGLAFGTGSVLEEEVKLGVLFGSLLSAAIASMVLVIGARQKNGASSRL